MLWAIRLVLAICAGGSARQLIVRQWQQLSVGLYSPHLELLEYYRQPGGVFERQVAIEDLGRILAHRRDKKAEDLFLAHCDTLGLAEHRPAIIREAVREAIDRRTRFEVEYFVKGHIGEVDESGLLEMVRESAISRAKARDWERFDRLCREWGLEDLLVALTELEGYLPEEDWPAEPPGSRFARAAGISL